MTPEKSKAIQKTMEEASDKLAAEAAAAFGAKGGEICEALADLANHMKYLCLIIDGDMAPVAAQHASFLARAKNGVCQLGGFDQKAFGDMMMKLAETRFYVHIPGHKTNG